MNELQDALDSAHAGHGTTVVLLTSPGVDTSRHLRAAALAAEARSLTTLRARGRRGERQLPFGVAVELFEDAWAQVRDRADFTASPARLAADLLEGRPAALATHSPDGRFAVIRSLAWLARSIAQRPAEGPPGPRGLALVVDDLHDADALSLRFLAYLAGRAAGSPIALLTALGPGLPTEDEMALGAIAAIGRVVRAPTLTPEEAVAQTRAALPGASARFCAACAQACASNPELLGALLSELVLRDVAPVDASIGLVAQTIPDSVLDGAAAVIARLSAPARALAGAIAEFGDAVGLDQAGAAARLSEAQVPGAFDALVAAGVLASDLPPAYSAPLLRRAVRASLTPGERIALGRARTGPERDVRAGGAPPTATLTPSEQRVAELAARGMTTKQIAAALYVTAKTVEFHLRNVYRKLNVPSSRTELTRILAPAPPIPPPP